MSRHRGRKPPASRPRVDGEGVALLLGFIAFAAACFLFVAFGAGWTTD